MSLPVIRWFIITYTHLLGCFVPFVVSCCSSDCFGIVLLFLERVVEFFPNFEPFPSEFSPLRPLLEQLQHSRTSDDFTELLNTQ